MKFRSNKSDLITAMRNVRDGVESTALVATEFVRVTVDQSGNAEFATTNLEMAITSLIKVEDSEPGVAVLPYALLSDLLSGLPDGSNVSFGLDGKRLALSCDGHEATVNGISPDEFPPLGDLQGDPSFVFEVKSGDLVRACDLVMFSAAQKSDRPVLTAVSVRACDDEHNALKLSCADGFRLSVAQLPVLSKQVSSGNNKLDILIPASTLASVRRLCGNGNQDGSVTIRVFSGRRVYFGIGDSVKLTAVLMDGKFPDYEQLIPSSFTCELAVKPDGLSQAIRFVRAISRHGGYIAVALHVDLDANSLHVSSLRSEEVGESKATIQIATANCTDKKDMRVAFNVDYLVELLDAVSDYCADGRNMIIRLSGPASPGLVTFEPFDYTHVLMPIFIQWE